MNFTQSELDSQLFKKLSTHISTLIDKKHQALEQDKDAVQTANIRGQIKAYRGILKIKPGENQDNDN